MQNTERENMKIVIVGGVAGGATAASKARRQNENAEISIYEQGPYLSFANCGLPYYIAGEIQDRQKLLLMTPEKFWEKYRVKAHVNHQVVSIDRASKTIKVKTPQGSLEEVAYDKLILSQGASPIVPPLQGVKQEHVFVLRDIPDMDRIHSFLENKNISSAVVIGGGFIGLEMAEALMHRGLKVSVVEKNPHVLPLLDDDMAAELTEELTYQGLHLVTGVGVVGIGAEDVALDDGRKLSAQMVLLSVGVKPEVAMAREAGLEIGLTGGVKANGRMQSSDPDIYVVGDAAETVNAITGARLRIPLAGPANRQGRIAGANAAGAHFTYPGALGTSIVRVLSRTVGYVGLNSKQAREAGFSFFTSMTRDPSHASYYPGAQTIVTKLIIEEGSGRLLGAQVLGEHGVDKRVDVLATAIYGKIPVQELESLDLAYAPPFSSAMDPVNMAAFVASHEVRGDVKLVNARDVDLSCDILIDVRENDELEKFGKLRGARQISILKIRDRLSEIPKDKKVVLYCQKGQRGYLAWQILSQRGYTNVYNLKGGFLQARHDLEVEK